jgi:hypothetical protein
MAFSIGPSGNLIIPSGIFPAQNLFGQGIGAVGIATPAQAGFTALQALTSTPLTAANGVTAAFTTGATALVNAGNTLVLGVLGAPLGVTSGAATSGAALLPVPFFGFPSGAFGAQSTQFPFPFPPIVGII